MGESRGEYQVVVSPGAAIALAAVKPTFRERVQGRLNELSAIARTTPGSLWSGWNPSVQESPLLSCDVDGTRVQFRVDFGRRRLHLVRLE
ncbi:MAG: hypothetical protein ACK4N5_11305 [Myxococcales bacterium]